MPRTRRIQSVRVPFRCGIGALVLALVALGGRAGAADLSREQVMQLLAQASGERANFDGKDLSDLDLSGLDLRRASLRGTSLFASKLVNADLRGTDLAGANLNGAWLMGADFTGAQLRDASLLSVVIL